MQCYRDTYKKSISVLSLNKDEEDRLIKIIECDFKSAMSLAESELMERREFLQKLLEKYGDKLRSKKESYSLWYMIGCMENNYRFALKEKRIV